MLVSEDLLKMFKKSIGDFNATTIMDNYYTNFLITYFYYVPIITYLFYKKQYVIRQNF